MYCSPVSPQPSAPLLQRHPIFCEFDKGFHVDVNARIKYIETRRQGRVEVLFIKVRLTAKHPLRDGMPDADFDMTIPYYFDKWTLQQEMFDHIERFRASVKQ